MEPSGRNRWQPVANGTPPKTAQISRSATGGKWDTPENRSNKPIRNRWQPTATVSERW
jgi:hypothetical protein